MAKQVGAARLDPEASVHIDAALAAWDKKRSKVATKYLGRGIRKELNDRFAMHRMFPQVAVLATVTEQPVVVTCLFQAFLEDIKYFDEMGFMGWEIVAPFRWCAEQLGLSGYEELFDETIEYNGCRRKPASEEITRPVTREDRQSMSWVGTVEEPKETWASDPVPLVNWLLTEMCTVATYRQYPYLNDWGWSLADYDAELREDARFVRARLGFEPDMPEFPEDPRVDLPDGFTGLPRLKWDT